ncbi:MAG: ATP-dependent DNA ligase [Acidimicrobiia bacterium]|nr:ATP-dependent DNA ligase [Acidimicrobiia bacterium]
MLFAALASASGELAATSKRSAKSAILAGVLAQLAPEEIEPTVGILTGTVRQGRIGVGWAQLRDLSVAPAEMPTLSISDVDVALEELTRISGPGSMAARRARLESMFADATEPEQRLLWQVIGGELRHGALEGVMLDAIARAAGVPLSDVRRGAMVTGSPGVAAVAALTGGGEALLALTLTPLSPIAPMLAASAPNCADALASTGAASVEWKLDGARVQVHRRGDAVRIFTRNLNDVTDRLGGVVDVVRTFPGGDLVLDGEVLGVDDGGSPRAFQDTISDFSADGTAQRALGLNAFFFDVLHAGDATVIDEPLSKRRMILLSIVPERHVIPAITTADAEEATAFSEAAVAAGHEGVMVKSLDSRYDAGRRGGAWRKVKPVHTFDLVVLAAEWGHGRRRGWLSNLHLGARDADGGFVMVGKTFKGLTDELLAFQTEQFPKYEVRRDEYTVYLRPEIVIEVAVDGVQRSPRYPGGVALRFARVRRYRPDKTAGEADTIESVRALGGHAGPGSA